MTRFSIVMLPLMVLILSMLALAHWEHQYRTGSPRTLAIQVRPMDAATATPELAVQALWQQQQADAPPVTRWDSRLSEAPVWVLLRSLSHADLSPQVIEFPSRHAVSLTCWNATTLEPLGHAQAQQARGAVREVRAGFALDLPPALERQDVLCQTRFQGAGRLAATQWNAPDLEQANLEFEHSAAMLNGGLLVLAAFVSILALINRNGLYLLFAVWFLINLRMGSVSVGWDSYWLGRVVPPEALHRSRLVTYALYYVVSVTFFRTLFHEELKKVNRPTALRWIQAFSFPLVVLSLALPASAFLPLIWVATALASCVIGYYLAQILLIACTPMALLYTASISLTVASSVYEVLAAAFGLQTLLGSVNSVTAALSSSLLAALAIAAQMQQEHQRRKQAEASLRTTFEVVPAGLFTLDLQGHFLSTNPALHAMLDLPQPAPPGSQWQHHFGADSWHDLLEQTRRHEAAELELTEQLPPQHREARRFVVRASLAGQRIEGSMQDITEKAKALERLQFLALHDPLTKSLNRLGIEQALASSLTRREGAHDTLPVAYVDLDRFHLINELFGHSAADSVLQQVHERIRSVLGPDLPVGRIGGDEFLVGLHGCTIAQATLMCQGIVNSIGARPYHVGERLFHVRGSVGLIEVVRGTPFKQALTTADWACRAAKTTNGSHLVVFERDSLAFKSREEELRLVEQLSSPDGLRQLYLEMQPIMSLNQPGASLNFEVLLRMRDPDGNTVPTPRLIAAAENSDRIGLLDRWVFKQTMDWIRAHHIRLERTQFVCMNLSGSSLNDEKFIEDMFAALAQYPDDAHFLCLEVTESVALHDLENTRAVIERLRGHGVKVALDDFGAGYTSFSYLRDLPSDLLKIDGSFVVNLNKHPANIAVLEGIVTLARNLGMKTIAEWAEDTATVQTLADIGVDYVQGFVIARPMAPEALLRKQSSADFVNDPALAQFLRELPLRTLPNPSAGH